MLYVDERVPLPEGSNFDIKNINKIAWMYYRKGASRRVDGKLKHDAVAIGKVVQEPEGFKTLIPNEHYYEYVAKTKPPSAGRISRRGRKSTPKEEKSYLKSEPGAVLGFGYGIACHKIAQELYIKPILCDVFGLQNANYIIAAASHMVISANNMSGMEDFTSNNMLFTDSVLTSQRLSRLYRQITPLLRDSFFSQWIERRLPSACSCYDVTSISSYSKNVHLVQYGYNRDGEKLSQVNVGLFCSMDDALPVFMEEYSGSINDFTNLPYVLTHLMELGFNGSITLVADGGFATRNTLEFIRENGFDYIIGAPMGFYPGIEQKMLNWRRSPLADGKSFAHDGDLFTFHETTSEHEGHRCRLILFQSAQSSCREKMTLGQAISRSEQRLSSINKLKFKQKLGNLKKDHLNLFDINVRDDGTVDFERNEEKSDAAAKLCGCFALFCTRDDLSPQKILEIYRAKDMCEKYFDVYKNDILNERTHVSGAESLCGKLFIGFIALLLRAGFKQKLGSMSKKKHSNTLDTLLKKLLYIRCRKCGEGWLLESALTSEQKEIVRLLNLDLHTLQTK